MNFGDSKLILLLKSLDKDEFEKLEEYICSPFFNKSNQITALFNILKKKYPDFEGLDKNFIYKKIYPGKTYKDKNLRDLFSRLLKLSEEFLAQLEFIKNGNLMNGFIMQQLSRKKLEKHFSAKAKELENIVKKHKITDGEYFFSKYSLLKEKRSFLEIQKSVGKREKFFGEITKEIDAFIYYSIYKIIKYYLNLENHSRLIKQDYDYKLRKEILEYLEKNPADDYPIIMIYFYMILMNINLNNNSNYFKAIELLEKNIGSIKNEDLKLIYTELYNYTRIRLTQGSEEFHIENYRILKDMVTRGVYPVEGNHLTENALITIFSTALIEKDYDWALRFLNEHIEMLPSKSKKNALSYCMGILNYRKGNYKEALEKLAKVSIDDFYHHIRVKNHEIKIFFELGDFEKVLFTIDSFRHFLGSNKLIPDYVKTRFSNYVNFTGRIANALLSNHPADKIIPIAKEINEHDSTLENRTWLLEQIDKIKK